MKKTFNLLFLFFLLPIYVTGLDTRAICNGCTFTGPAAQFCNAAIDNLCVNGNAQILGDLTVCGTINGATGSMIPCLCTCPLFGNVVRVDKVYGNDATGAPNGCPFLTINAALAAASSGDTVWIFPGTYEESLIIPKGVSVRGLSRNNVTIQQTDVTQATDLITMGENIVFEDIVLHLTSSEQVQLRAMVFPGTTTLTSQVRRCFINVSNLTVEAGSSNVYAVHATGAAVLPEHISTIMTCSINATSNAGGATRGVLVDSANNDLHIQNTNIMASGVNGIAIETNNPTAQCVARYCLLEGDLADISQTAGTLSLINSELFNSQANGLGFVAEIEPNTIIWADPGSLPGGINYMRPGSSSVSPYIINLRASQKLLIKSLNVRAQFPPGGSVSDTWTVMRNGVATPLTVSLTGSQNTNINDTVSVHYDLGDDIALMLNRAPTSGTIDVILIMDLY